MLVTNKFIYLKALELQELNLEDFTKLSVSMNFFIQKNIEEVHSKAVEIEKSRDFIIKKYGEQVQEENENGEESSKYIIPQKYIEVAQQELDALLDIKQDIKISQIKLSELSTYDIDTKTLKAILFMIEDDLSNESKED